MWWADHTESWSFVDVLAEDRCCGRLCTGRKLLQLQMLSYAWTTWHTHTQPLKRPDGPQASRMSQSPSSISFTILQNSQHTHKTTRRSTTLFLVPNQGSCLMPCPLRWQPCDQVLSPILQVSFFPVRKDTQHITVVICSYLVPLCVVSLPLLAGNASFAFFLYFNGKVGNCANTENK